MAASTRGLHDAIDDHIRRTGIPYLNPDEPTVQLDLLGSRRVIEWQEGKAAFLFASEGCWSELPHLYARYGTTATAQLIARLKALEHASAALVCDSGMQATALVFDVLRRYLEYNGYSVTFVKNFTDVDDKIIKRANEQGVSCDEVTAKFIRAYYDDMGRLGVRPATIEPRATEHMADIIRLTDTLIQKGMIDFCFNFIFHYTRSNKPE